MQNKGFVKFIAVVLTLVCLFYMSFSFVASRYDSKIEELAKTDSIAAGRYEDSLKTEKVYLGVWTLQECRAMGIGLGLDLKGGMSAILEVSVPDVVKALSGNNTTPKFTKALEEATEATVDGGDFIEAFDDAYEGNLAEVFATQQLRDKVNVDSKDSEVKDALKEEVSSAIANSYNVIRSRIDRFGVAQPNIQKLEGSRGRIMVELPGVKDADIERVSKLLEGSANLEFWRTWEASEVIPSLVSLDAEMAKVAALEDAAEVAT